MRVIIILFMFSFLFSCASTKIEEVEITKIPPQLPAPISYYNFDWKIGIEHNVPEPLVIVGLPYDDSLDFRLFLEDIKRYVEQLNDVLCFYSESDFEMCSTPNE